MKHLGFITLTLLVLALTACASGTAPAVEAPPPTAELGVAPAYPEPPTLKADIARPYPEPAATLPSPTSTPEPTAKTAGQRTEPQVVLEIDGQAETVTDNYELPACGKAVFYWTVDVGASGVASLIALLHDVAAEREEVLVNEVALEAGGDTVTWPALRLLDAGEYYFTTENTDEPWSLRVECQDGMAPVAEGLDVSGEGLTVTDNYQLRACSKSVFAWSIEPNASGAASAIVELYKAGLDQPVVVANEFQMDATQPVTGQSVRSVSAGPHYLFVYNTANRWRVTWECQD